MVHMTFSEFHQLRKCKRLFMDPDLFDALAISHPFVLLKKYSKVQQHKITSINSIDSIPSSARNWSYPICWPKILNIYRTSNGQITDQSRTASSGIHALKTHAKPGKSSELDIAIKKIIIFISFYFKYTLRPLCLILYFIHNKIWTCN